MPRSRRATDRHGQLDQLGARRRAGRLLLQGLLRGDARATSEPVDFAVPSGNFGNILAGHVARADGPADPAAHPRDQRERRARRVLPHRPLPSARSRARRTRRRARRWTSRRRRTSSASSSTSSAATRRSCASCGASSTRDGGFDLAGTPHWARVRGAPASSPGAARTPTASRRSATSHARYGVVVDPHTADGIKVGLEHREPARPAGLPRDGAAGEVRRDDPRGARPRARAARRLRGPRSAAAALSRAAAPTPRSVQARIIAAARGRPPDAPSARSPLASRSRHLLRNLVAGLRLALFLPVSPLAFRVDLVQLVAAVRRVGARRHRARLGALRRRGLLHVVRRSAPRFFGAGLLLLTAAVLALAFGATRIAALALPVYRARVASRCCRSCARAVRAARRSSPARDRSLVAFDCADARRGSSSCSCAALRWRSVAARRGAGCARSRAASLLVAPIWFALVDRAERPVVARRPSARRRRSALSEPGVRAGARRAEAAARRRARRARRRAPGVTDLYFVGFAGDAREDVFRKDVEAAQQVMDERWGTDGRSIVLINNPRTLLDRAVRAPSPTCARR